MERVSLDVEELRSAMVAELDRITRRWGGKVQMSTDHFWAIQNPRLLMEGEGALSPDVTIGQVSDSFEFLRSESVDNDTPDVIIAMRLRWLAELALVLAAELTDPGHEEL